MKRVLARPLVAQVLRFLGVGGVSYVIDTGLFVVLSVVGIDAVLAKVVSSVVAISTAYVGNRWVTFAGAGRGYPVRQTVLFLAVNAVAAAVATGCLWVSQHVLGLTGPIPDTVAANVVGVALGMLVRFVLYRTVVFRGPGVTADQEPPTVPLVGPGGSLLASRSSIA